MSDPFKIEGPAAISFSGGRTSAYMLWRIVQAHGGALPDDIVVVFANTGKEREETLRFVYECGVRWGVQIHWVEWRLAAPGFEEVGFNSASRRGEPFEALIRHKKFLPNWQARWCTQYLKVLAMRAFLMAWGFRDKSYAEVIGLRADELPRVAKMLGRNKTDGRRCLAPLWEAGIGERDVLAFWADQPFDLMLKKGEGNCDLCFLKGKRLRKAILRDTPGVGDWWAGLEIEFGAWFDRRDSVTELMADVDAQADLFADPAEEFDSECGLICVTAEA